MVAAVAEVATGPRRGCGRSRSPDYPSFGRVGALPHCPERVAQRGMPVGGTGTRRRRRGRGLIGWAGASGGHAPSTRGCPDSSAGVLATCFV